MSSKKTNSGKNLKGARDKRKRVNRIKFGIVFFIFGSIILSLIAVVFLLFKVLSLQNRLEKVENNSNEINYNSAEPVNTASNNDNIIPPEENGATNVYLTFDDGPSDNTNSILDTLAKYNVKATFFVIGKEDDASKQAYKRIVNEGHSLGMHSYSHKYSEVYASFDAFKGDVEKLRSYLESIVGFKPTLYRFPGGSSNKVSNVDIQQCISYLGSQNVRYYDWNVSSGDAASNAYTVDELVDNVMKDVLKYKTSVVLLHDANAKTTTAEALPKLLETLQAANVNILPITDSTPLVQHVKAQ